MSTTIRRVLLALPLVALGWIAVMAVVMRFSDAAPAAVVPFPGRALIASLPPDVAILDISKSSVTFANRPNLARTLYRSGAWLVLPAGLTGCLPLPKKQRDALSTD